MVSGFCSLILHFVWPIPIFRVLCPYVYPAIELLAFKFKVLAVGEQLARSFCSRIKSQIIEAYAIIHFEVECARTHTMIQEHGPGSLSLCVCVRVQIYMCENAGKFKFRSCFLNEDAP